MDKDGGPPRANLIYCTVNGIHFSLDRPTKTWNTTNSQEITVDSTMFSKPLPELIAYLQELNEKYPGESMRPGSGTVSDYYGDYCECSTTDFTIKLTNTRQATEEEMIKINEYLEESS